MAMSITQPSQNTEAHKDDELGDDFERKLGQVLPTALPLVFIVAAIVVGSLYDLGSAILVLAGGALLGTIAFLWASLRTLTGDAPISLDEAVALGSQAENEEQKRTVLQALKDLEYEFSVGKIGEEDYRELRRRYRAEAKRLLRSLDRDLEPSRERAEAYLEERRAGKSDRALIQMTKQATRACAACGIDNDEDARFCKGCGGGLAIANKEGAKDAVG